MRSHIIPEVYYSGIYENKKLLVIDGHIENVYTKQKGVYEHLLCSECEGVFNDRWEKPYLQTIHTRLPSIHYDNQFSLQNSNIELFLLFHQSILWRMIVSRGDMWKNICHSGLAESLRMALIRNDPYVCKWFTVQGILLIDETGVAIKDFISKPSVMPIADTEICYVCWGGAEWLYVLGETKDSVVSNISDLSGGTIRFLVMPFFKSVSVNGFTKYMACSMNRPRPSGRRQV